MRTESGTVMVRFSIQNASFTPKAERINQLMRMGKSFDEAFAIADREYTSDGMALNGVVRCGTGTTVVKHGQEARAI